MEIKAKRGDLLATLYWTQSMSSTLYLFYRPPAFSLALMIILFASSPESFVTVKCATDWRRRFFFFHRQLCR